MSVEFLIPVNCFLHRVFPVSYYENQEELIKERLFKPRKDSDQVSLNFPLDWEAADKVVDRNWRMQLQGWTFFHPIMNIFDNYENKKEIIEYFFDTLHDWWEQYGQDPDNIVTSRMPSSYAWYDMSVGFRALIISFFKNRINYYQLGISEDQRNIFEKVAAKHIRHLLVPEVFSMNNHGLFQSHGLVGLLKLFPHLSESYDKDLKYALGLVEDLIVSQFGDIGVHLEHSPHYHFYALSSLKAQIESGWYDQNKRIKEISKRAEENCKWLVDPLKRPICVGDSILTVQKDIDFPNQYLGGYVLSDFCSAGYAIARSGWAEPAEKSSMLFLVGGYHTKSHKHRDCLSFDWFDRGRRIICDSGKYGYRSDVYRNYFLSNRAHNTVEIEGFDILKIKPYQSIVENPVEVEKGIFCLKGSLDYPAIKQHRDIYFKPGSWLIVKDSLIFVRERGFKQWFHLDKDFILQSSQENILSFKGDDGFCLTLECLQKDLSLEIHYGNEKEMQGFLCEKDYQYIPSIALGFGGVAKNKDIYTILSLSDDAHNSAKKFLADSLNYNVDKFYAEFSTKKQILKGKENVIFESCEDLICSKEKLTGEKTFQVSSEDITFSFYGSFKESSKKLAIFLPGATSRRYGPYDFQRYSWGPDFKEFDCLFFSDPSIKEENDLTLGWFQCKEDSFGIKYLKLVIDSLLKAKGYSQDDLFIFGSSAGGFVSLKLSEFFKSALIVAINPQIFLYNYNKSFYNRMIDSCYEGRSPEFVKLNYIDRLVFNPDLDSSRGNPIFILQNMADDRHYQRHFLPLAKRYSIDVVDICDLRYDVTNKKINLCLFEDGELGHTPPNKEDTIRYINKFLDLSSFI